MPKGGTAVGIECDSRSLRAAKLTSGKSGGKPAVLAVEEITGRFSKDEEIAEGLTSLRRKMGISSSDAVITCVGGKQAYTAQLSFKKMPDEEMKTALKFEIRKNLSFDTAGAAIDFQFLAEPARKNDPVPVVVTAVSQQQVQRHLLLFEKANIVPTVLEVLPLTIANAFLSDRANLEKSELGRTILHIGPEYSTLVVEGTGIPFYTRTIYFAAGELFGREQPPDMSPEEFVHRITVFSEEINRSLVYYESAFKTMTSSELTVLGPFDQPELLEKITGDTGLKLSRLELAKQFEVPEPVPAGKFETAIALALRGME